MVWAPFGFFVGAYISHLIMPDILEQPLSYAVIYGNYDPADHIIPLSMLASIFGIPLIALIFTKIVSRLSAWLHVSNAHLWLILTFIGITLGLVGGAATYAIPLYSYFAYLVCGTVLVHYLAYVYRARIPAVFYKYVEYVYVLVTVGGLWSASSVVDGLYMRNILSLEKRVYAAQQEALSTNCLAGWANEACLDYGKLEKLKDELRVLQKNRPKKLNSIYKAAGYFALAFALSLKLLKITGEIKRWHRQ